MIFPRVATCTALYALHSSGHTLQRRLLGALSLPLSDGIEPAVWEPQHNTQRTVPFIPLNCLVCASWMVLLVAKEQSAHDGRLFGAAGRTGGVEGRHKQHCTRTDERSVASHTRLPGSNQLVLGPLLEDVSPPASCACNHEYRGEETSGNAALMVRGSGEEVQVREQLLFIPHELWVAYGSHKLVDISGETRSRADYRFDGFRNFEQLGLSKACTRQLTGHLYRSKKLRFTGSGVPVTVLLPLMISDRGSHLR